MNFKTIKEIHFILLPLIILMLSFFISCNNQPAPGVKSIGDSDSIINAEVPGFNEDSAFYFVEKQVSFGPRVPNTPAHRECAVYLENTLRRYTSHVVVQEFRARAFDGTILQGKNIIGSFNKDKKGRILLCAHWDSRPFADHDPDLKNHYKPIDGANDGASGVGVLLEIARQLEMNPPPIGVDIIFFDAEDYGPHQENQQSEGTDFWGLGSQYWSKNPHEFNYRAKYAILLDMVGVPDPQFLKEGFSMYYAPDKVRKVWAIAREIGYGDHFINKEGGYITDDHYYINKYKNIPAINIIHLDPRSPNGTFFEHWHTINDDIDHVDKRSLAIVGETVLTVVFREK